MPDRQRQKRQVRAPRKYEEDEDGALKKGLPAGSKTSTAKSVIRKLLKKEVNKDLRNQQVYILWPDDNKWYEGQIQQLRVKEMVAHMWYPETDEKEDVDLADLIQEGQIGFKETRPRNHKLTTHETLWEEDQPEDAPPAPKRSQSKQQANQAGSQGRAGSAAKKGSSKPRKMKRISGDPSGDEGGEEEENDEEDPKPALRNRRKRRGSPISSDADQPGADSDDPDVSLSSSDDGSEQEADGDEDIEEDDPAPKNSAKEGLASETKPSAAKLNGRRAASAADPQAAVIKKRSRQGSDQQESGSPKKAHVSTASAAPGMQPSLPQAPNVGLAGYMTGLTPDMLAAMTRKASEAPFYAPATHLTQLGGMSNLSRPLQRLPSAHSGDNSTGIPRGPATGRAPSSLPLVPPGPSRADEEVREKARTYFKADRGRAHMALLIFYLLMNELTEVYAMLPGRELATANVPIMAFNG
ncbi:hypothetical protein WJX84_010950 [Apatococcus fuscideae]|uniref:Uncharacterized protein n=1 Tax=Apatococcus fuscideae TaxID=2026836 RepID=A0AAW1TDF9_9CHLO